MDLLTLSSEGNSSFLRERHWGQDENPAWLLKQDPPSMVYKAHSQPSMMLEWVYGFFNREGKRKINISNTLPSPKSSLLLMFRSVNN